MGIQQVGEIPRLVYLFVVPAVILPAIVGIPRRTVVWSTVLATLTWGLGGFLVGHVMMSVGLVILTPGL